MQFESAYTNSSWKRLWIHCDDCCKNFTKALYLKRHIYKLLMNHTKHRIEITNHSWSWEEKDSIVINVAKILLEDEIWKYLYKMFMKLIYEINCEDSGKNFTKFSKLNMNFVMILLSMLVITRLAKNSWGLCTLQKLYIGQIFCPAFLQQAYFFLT